MGKEVVAYHTRDGKEPFIDWLNQLGDEILENRIWVRIHRMQQGNFGDHKRFNGIIELRLHFGKGYRIYCGEDGINVVILLIGGDKSSQDKNIKQAFEYWRDHNEQKKI